MQAQTHHELTLHPTARDYGQTAIVTDKQPLLK
jgi:hypothetical protein